MESGADFRKFIEREFQNRVRRNPAYSLRAFARALSMQPSKLSEVLRGLCGLSVNSAQRIAGELKLSQEETQYFVSLVEAQHGRSKASRRKAQEKIGHLRASDGFDELSLDRFRIISDWHHFAILELTELAYYESSATWIAGRLGIPTDVAQEAIELLLDFGLLKNNSDGKLTATNIHFATPSGIPSRELREHHSQILRKAEAALENVEIQERDFSAMTLALDSREMDAAKQELKEFRRKFSRDRQASTSKDRVYCLGIQLFPVDQITENRTIRKKRNSI